MSERGYLDDVPLRLTSKYYPQPRPQFKEIDIHIPIDALQDDYDFSLERSVITEVAAWDLQKVIDEKKKAEEAVKKAQEEEKCRLEAEEKRRLEEKERLIQEENERLRLEKEEKQRLEDERLRLEENEKLKVEEERLRLEEDQRRSEEEERLRIEQEEAFILEEKKRKQDKESKRIEELKQHEEDELLRLAKLNEIEEPKNEEIKSVVIITKTKEESIKITSPKTVEGNATGNKKITNDKTINETRINLSDFESDTANPFDNVEINSINEMEVLASILKNNSVSVPPSQNYSYRSYPNIPSSCTNYNVNGVSVSQPPFGNQHNTHPINNSFPTMYNTANNPYAAHQPTWNAETFYAPTSPSSAPELPSRTTPTLPTNQSNNPVTSSNSFTKYYFPLLTSMTDSRRDRQNQPSNNINPGYSHPIQNSGSNPPALGLNPFLNPSHSPIQHFPILGSLSQHYWSNDGTAGTVPTYNVPSNIPTSNGPQDKPNLSPPPAGTDLSASSSNGTQHILR